MPTFDQLEQRLKILVGILGVITAVYTIYKRVFQPWYKQSRLRAQQREINNRSLVESAEQMVIAIQKLDNLEETVMEIKRHVLPNGGGSLSDSVKRIELSVEERFDSIEEVSRIMSNMQGYATWTSDNKGEWTYASLNLCRILERDEKELLGNRWLSCLCKFDEDRIILEWRRSLIEHRPFEEVCCFKIEHSNEFLKVKMIASPRKHKKTGEYNGAIGSISIYHD